MAYPTVSAPYGLVPVNRIDGLPYAGAIRQIPVAAGYATAIFNGDTVKLDGLAIWWLTLEPTMRLPLVFWLAVSMSIRLVKRCKASITRLLLRLPATMPWHMLWMTRWLPSRSLLFLPAPRWVPLVVLWLVATWLWCKTPDRPPRVIRLLQC